MKKNGVVNSFRIMNVFSLRSLYRSMYTCICVCGFIYSALSKWGSAGQCLGVSGEGRLSSWLHLCCVSLQLEISVHFGPC